MHTFESKNKQEIDDFVNFSKPDIFEYYTRTDPETMGTIYGVKWYKIKTDKGMTVNEILRIFDDMRKIKKIPRSKIVEAAGMTESTFYLYLNGRNLSQFNRIIKMLDAVGLELVVRQKR